MNGKNSTLMNLVQWARFNDVDLSNVDIDMQYRKITFHHGLENQHNFRKVKRAINNFVTHGNPPYVELKREIEIGENGLTGPDLVKAVESGELEEPTRWRIKWNGAYECKVSYECGPMKFADGADAERDLERVEHDTKRNM